MQHCNKLKTSYEEWSKGNVVGKTYELLLSINND